MTELVDWLRQQLDEDERVARAATPGPWVVKPADSVYAKPSAVVLRTDVDVDAPWSNEWVSAYVVNPQEEGGEGIDSADAEHIARWDPARVLAEVEAKRRVLDEHKPMDGVGERIVGCATCSWRDDWDELHVEWPCTTLRLLAQPYAGREGWQEAWRADQR